MTYMSVCMCVYTQIHTHVQIQMCEGVGNDLHVCVHTHTYTHIYKHMYIHKCVQVWAMTYMSCAHIYRMVVDYGGWTIDFTTPQLLVTQKMMNIAFALYDSARDPAKLTAEQRQRKLDKPPTASEFYGYVFCLHTLLAGPATDYNDYLTWIDGSKLGGAKCNTVFAILKKISGAVMCAIAFVVILPNCPVDNHGVSEWLSSNPHWYVLGYNQVSLFLVRHRYYFAWILGDAGCNAAGFGFNGLDAKGAQKWDSVLNLDYVSVEMPLNFRSAMTGWNKATSNWLRRCVYERVPKGIATASSFFMSAIWHGFYPGYYLTFMSCALWNEVARLLRRHVRPLVIPNEAAEKSVTAYVYHACSLCLTVTSLNYLATPFLLLSADKSLQYWRHWGFAPHGIALGLYILLPIIFAPRKAPKGEKLTEAQAKKAQ
jgi:hypothetical protein